MGKPIWFGACFEMMHIGNTLRHNRNVAKTHSGWPATVKVPTFLMSNLKIETKQSAAFPSQLEYLQFSFKMS